MSNFIFTTRSARAESRSVASGSPNVVSTSTLSGASSHTAAAPDPRVRMRRAHHRRVRLTRQAEVVGEAPGAGEQALVLLAPQGLSYRACHALGRAQIVHWPRCFLKKSIDSASARSASGLL